MIHDLDEFKNIPVDYDSPINIVVNQMASEIAKFTEDGVMQAVVKAGFDIDKDKFVSILQQDRQRYNEAYLKGYKDRDGEIVRCRDCKWWDKKDESDYGYCHACKHGYSSPHWEIGIYRTYKGNWYCADGEREDEDEEEDIQTDEE